jgi:hypothetical protein
MSTSSPTLITHPQEVVALDFNVPNVDFYRDPARDLLTAFEAYNNVTLEGFAILLFAQIVSAPALYSHLVSVSGVNPALVIADIQEGA